MKRLILVLVLSLIGLLDATYLRVKDLLHKQVACSVVSGCENVLTSKYSHVFGIPISALGAGFYLTVLILAAVLIQHRNYLSQKLLWIFVASGFLVSCFLVILQIFVIHSICMYCLLSAAINITLFITELLFSKEDLLD